MASEQQLQGEAWDDAVAVAYAAMKAAEAAYAADATPETKEALYDATEAYADAERADGNPDFQPDWPLDTIAVDAANECALERGNAARAIEAYEALAAKPGPDATAAATRAYAALEEHTAAAAAYETAALALLRAAKTTADIEAAQVVYADAMDAVRSAAADAHRVLRTSETSADLDEAIEAMVNAKRDARDPDYPPPSKRVAAC